MKNILTFVLLMFSIYVKSQDTVKIPVFAARNIAKDLAICDSVKAIHELTKQQLILTENKIVIKDSVIDTYKTKCYMYDTIISNQEKKFDVQKAWTEQIRKDNKGLKARLLYTKISMGAIILFLGYLLAK